MTTETAPQKTAWRPAASCATSAPAAKPRFTAPPSSATQRRLSCCSTPEQNLMQKTHTATRR